MEKAADVIIIGAGIAGVSLASELSPDKKIILLEAEDQPGYHATGRSAAIYLPTYGPPAILALTRASGNFFHHPPDGFCQTPLLCPRGTMLIGTDGDGDAVAEGIDTGMKEIPLKKALEKLPALRTDIFTRTLIDDDAMDVDVDLLLQSHLKRAKANETSLHCKAKVGSITRKSDQWIVETTSGTFMAATLVNAAGAWADEIAAMAGTAKCGLVPKRRSAALLELAEDIDVSSWPLTFGAGDTFYIRPLGGKLMISPADETPSEPHDAWADDYALAEAVEYFQQATGLHVTRLEAPWAGLRTFAPDGNPVIGFDDKADGFFWLAGQGGYGIQTSPAISRLATALIRQTAMPQDLQAHGVDPDTLSPNRFAARSR